VDFHPRAGDLNSNITIQDDQSVDEMAMYPHDDLTEESNSSQRYGAHSSLGYSSKPNVPKLDLTSLQKPKQHSESHKAPAQPQKQHPGTQQDHWQKPAFKLPMDKLNQQPEKKGVPGLNLSMVQKPAQGGVGGLNLGNLPERDF
jgi:hypothetical protein